MQPKLKLYMIPFMLFTYLLLAQQGLASPVLPVIDDHINTYLTGSQSEPAIAMLKNGKTVVTWQSKNQDGDGFGIFARIYNGNTPLAPEFQVNTYTELDQLSPSVAALTNGGFVITWHSYTPTEEEWDAVFAQRYKEDGTKEGAEFKVNTYDTMDQQFSVVAGLTNGGFVIAWRSLDQDGSSYGVYAQRYKADGTPDGAEFRVNTYTTSAQLNPSIAALGDGSFVIAWYSQQDPDYDFPSYGVYAQIYKADGTTNGNEFRVNTYFNSSQKEPSVAALNDGGFIVAWSSYMQVPDNSTFGVFAQMYNADGTQNGEEFLVNTYVTDSQKNPAVASLPDGGFVIAWHSQSQDGVLLGVYAQAYSVSGTKSGAEIQINTETWLDQMKPCVTGLQNGFAIAWQSIAEKDGETGYGVYGKWLVCPASTPYYADNTCYEACPAGLPLIFQKACVEECPISAQIVYNNECFSECPAEAPVAQGNTCTGSQAPPKEAEVINGENKATDITMKIFSIFNSNNPTYVFLSNSDSMILYIRYLRVTYPEKVLRMFQARGKDMISTGLGIGVPQTVEQGLTRQLLLDLFKVYDVNSSFLYHLWDPVISFLILIFATVVVIILEYLTRNSPKIHFVFKTLLYIAKWNLPLIIICGNFNNIMFYSILEFKEANLETSLKNLSFAASILTLFVVALTIMMAILIARNIRQSKENPKLKKEWNDFAVLYQPFKDESYLTLGFFPIYFLRVLVFNIILTASFSSAVPQTVIIAVISFLFVVYLLWKRPLKSKLLMTQVIFNEMILLILNIAVVTLAAYDHQNKEALSERDSLGELIIIMNILFSTSNLVFIGIIAVLVLITVYKKVQTAKSQGCTSWSQIITFVLTPQPDEPQAVSPSFLKKETQSVSPVPSYLKKEPQVTLVAETSRSKLFAQSPTNEQSPGLQKSSFDLSSDSSITKTSPELRARKPRQSPTEFSLSSKTLLGGSGIVLQDMKQRNANHEDQKRITPPYGRVKKTGPTKGSDDVEEHHTLVESPVTRQTVLKNHIANMYGPKARSLKRPINL